MENYENQYIEFKKKYLNLKEEMDGGRRWEMNIANSLKDKYINMPLSTHSFKDWSGEGQRKYNEGLIEKFVKEVIDNGKAKGKELNPFQKKKSKLEEYFKNNILKVREKRKKKEEKNKKKERRLEESTDYEQRKKNADEQLLKTNANEKTVPKKSELLTPKRKEELLKKSQNEVKKAKQMSFDHQKAHDNLINSLETHTNEHAQLLSWFKSNTAKQLEYSLEQIMILSEYTESFKRGYIDPGLIGFWLKTAEKCNGIDELNKLYKYDKDNKVTELNKLKSEMTTTLNKQKNSWLAKAAQNEGKIIAAVAVGAVLWYLFAGTSAVAASQLALPAPATQLALPAPPTPLGLPAPPVVNQMGLVPSNIPPKIISVDPRVQQSLLQKLMNWAPSPPPARMGAPLLAGGGVKSYVWQTKCKNDDFLASNLKEHEKYAIYFLIKEIDTLIEMESKMNKFKRNIRKKLRPKIKNRREAVYRKVDIKMNTIVNSSDSTYYNIKQGTYTTTAEGACKYFQNKGYTNMYRVDKKSNKILESKNISECNSGDMIIYESTLGSLMSGGGSALDYKNTNWNNTGKELISKLGCIKTIEDLSKTIVDWNNKLGIKK